MSDPFDLPDFAAIDNVVDLIARQASAGPQRPAIVDAERTISYAELHALTLAYGACLRAHGIAEGDRLGLMLRDRSDHLVLMLAAGAVGAATVSLDWRSKIDEKRAVAAAFKLKLVVADADARAPEGTASLQLDQLRQEASRDPGPAEPVANQSLPLRILLTSGTTGLPKGVELTHAGLLVWCESVAKGLRLTAPQRHLSMAPLAFTGSFNYNLPHLLLGNTVELFPPLFAPEELIDAIKTRHITSTVVVPTILRRLLAFAPPRGHLFPELSYLISLGAPLTPDERRAALHHLSPGFHEVYGASGAGAITFLLPEDVEAHAESVGRPAPLCDVQIVGPGDEPLPDGEVGLLRCRGRGVARSFCNGEEASSTDAFRDGWYYPGEIARRDAEEFIYIVGRASDVILSAGLNIYPMEIERILMRHPAVQEAAVVGIPSPDRGEEIMAFVRLSTDTPQRDLLEICLRHLTSYKIPKAIVVVQEFPKNAAGKILKNELRLMVPDPAATGKIQ